MNSSRMRSARLLTISQHALCRGVSARGVSVQEGVRPGGCLPRGVCGRPPVNRMKTGVKTSPCRNFVAGGNNSLLIRSAVYTGETSSSSLSQLRFIIPQHEVFNALRDIHIRPSTIHEFTAGKACTFGFPSEIPTLVYQVKCH